MPGNHLCAASQENPVQSQNPENDNARMPSKHIGILVHALAEHRVATDVQFREMDLLPACGASSPDRDRPDVVGGWRSGVPSWKIRFRIQQRVRLVPS